MIKITFYFWNFVNKITQKNKKKKKKISQPVGKNKKKKNKLKKKKKKKKAKQGDTNLHEFTCRLHPGWAGADWLCIFIIVLQFYLLWKRYWSTFKKKENKHVPIIRAESENRVKGCHS